MKMYICIDIGGTAIKYGQVSGRGEILEFHERASQANLGGPRLVANVLEILDGYLKKTEQTHGSALKGEGEKAEQNRGTAPDWDGKGRNQKNIPDQDVERKPYAGICISTAGIVNPVSGEILHSGPTIPDYQGTCWKQILEDTCHLPVEVENDVNCACLAEAMAGAGRGCRSVLALTVGTGIGGAFYLRGEGCEGIYRGFSNAACEVGYMDLGQAKSFEEMASTSVLCRSVAETRGESLEDWDGLRVFTAAKAGDAVCVRAIDRMVDLLGRGMANLTYILNPECIVLGGGIMKQKEYLYPRLRNALDHYLVPSIAEKTGLALAARGNQAGMLGAYYHFKAMREKRS